MENSLAISSPKHLSLPTLSETLWRACIERVSSIAEVPASFVEFVAECYTRQIRHGDKVQTAMRVMKEVEDVAKDYGARNTINEDTAKECMRFIFEKFGFLALDEIRYAYRMWASEELEIEGAELYGGSFNVRQIGKVLAAYNDKRKVVLGRYMIAVQETADEVERLKRETELKEKFEAEFPEIVMKAKVTITDWRQVPEFWYDSIKKRWGIEFEPGEAEKILEDAKALALFELNQESTAVMTDFERFEARTRRGNLEETAKVIARKISIFRKVLSNPAFQIEVSKV